MQKSFKKKIQGVLMPYAYNSNGKVVGFFMQSLCGKKFILQADNLLRKLRKVAYQTVTVQAEQRVKKGKEYYLVKNIQSQMY